MPEISRHFQSRVPSPIRQAQILFADRKDRDEIDVVNLAIGNVSLPMHPAMQERMRGLGSAGSPFSEGIVKYTESRGTEDARRAFLNIIASTGADTSGLYCGITDGGSAAMELMVLGVCGPGSDRPLVLLDPAYANYVDMARRACVETLSIPRTLSDQGRFEAPDLGRLEELIVERRPHGIVVIPADNPTGQYLRRDEMIAVAHLAVKYDLWLVSDEAYRQLHYTGGEATSVWTLSEEDVPGIHGRRISIESSSKVWNACGLRIGALVTDNELFHRKAVAESTANLCANAIGQHIFGGIAEVGHEDLATWYEAQRSYYREMMSEVVDGIRRLQPEVIVTTPESSLYVVVDVRGHAPESFDSAAFVNFCAERGRVHVDGLDRTLLTAPMADFYAARGENPGTKQLRLAFVEPPEKMKLVPELFSRLYEEFLSELSGSAD